MAVLPRLGRYELRRVLGKGAMGVVYEGFDPTLGRRVAVKAILKSVAIDEETAAAYSARFVREAKAVGRLNHPHIVQVHDFGEHNEVAYLVMEYIEGRELRAFFDAGEKFEPAECVRIMGELLDALDFAHEAGVIHRDIKPANVMLDGQRRVKLADFGVARVQESERSTAGTMVGTPAFMSPEQIQGAKIDRRTDLFSAGTILYQLLTGEQPFKGEGAWTVAKKIVESDPPLPSSIVVSVSPVFDGIVYKALAKKPADRFASAKEFAAALRGALAPGAQAAAIVAPKPRARVESKASEAEVEFWRALQNSNDAAEFEFYLEQFPEGTYAQLARHKIAKLREPQEAARREAEGRARREAEERARLEAENRARREAEEKAKREAAEKAKREAAEKARREAEEKARQAQALARLRQQEEAAARARAAVDEEATVAIGKPPEVAAPPESTAEKRRSIVIPSIVAAVVLVGGLIAYLVSSRTPAPPAPVAQAPASPKAEQPAPAKPEAPAIDVEKIRREAEERVRREYADKSAAEQAAAAKAAGEKAVAEKQAAAKAAAEKAAVEKSATEKAAAEKSIAARAAAEKAAAEKAAVENAAAEKAAAEKLAAEKAASEKAAAQKAAPTASRLPKEGDWWTYRITDHRDAVIRRQDIVEVRSVTESGVVVVSRRGIVEPFEWTHVPGAYVVGSVPGAVVFAPHLGAFRPLKAGDRWDNVRHSRMRFCSSEMTCRFTAVVKGTDRVTVEAGEFQAFRIELELRWMAPGGVQGTRMYTLWYSDAVKRMVKLTGRDSGGVSTFEPDMDIELIAFELH